MDDQKIRLINEVVGAEAYASLSAALAETKAEAAALALKLAAGELTFAEHAAAARDNDLAQRTLLKAIKEVAPAVDDEAASLRAMVAEANRASDAMVAEAAASEAAARAAIALVDASKPVALTAKEEAAAIRAMVAEANRASDAMVAEAAASERAARAAIAAADAADAAADAQGRAATKTETFTQALDRLGKEEQANSAATVAAKLAAESFSEALNRLSAEEREYEAAVNAVGATERLRLEIDREAAAVAERKTAAAAKVAAATRDVTAAYELATAETAAAFAAMDRLEKEERSVAESAKLAAVGTHELAQAIDAATAKEYELADTSSAAVKAAMALMDAQSVAGRSAAGAAREYSHLNDVLVAGLSMEQAAVRTVANKSEGLKSLAAQLQTNARLQDGLTTSVGHYGTATAAAAGSTSQAGFAMLNLSHAVQDAQYGFAAVLNNIPLIVTAMGGGAGLAGTIMTVGVALNVAKPIIGDFGTALGLTADKAKDTGTTLQGLKDKLEALTAKGWKVKVDYEMEEETERRIKELEKRLQAFEANKERPADEFVKKIAEDKTKDIGGAGELAKIAAANEAAAGRSHGDESDINTARNAKRAAAKIRDFNRGSIFGEDPIGMAADFEAKAAAAEERIRKANETFAMSMAGSFAKGEQTGVDYFKSVSKAGRVGLSDAQQTAIGSVPSTRQQAEELYAQQSPKAKADEEAEIVKQKKNAALVKTLNEQGVEGHELAGQQTRAVAERDRQELIQGTPDRKDAAKRFTDQVKENLQALNGTSLDEEAMAAAARLRGQGGYQDQRGRFHKQDRDQQQATLTEDLRGQIHQRNPGLDRDTVNELAHRMATQAVDKVDDARREGEAQLRGDLGAQAQATGMSVNQVLGVNRDTQANQLIMAEVMRGIIANADLAAGQVQQVRQQLQMLGNGVARNGTRLKTQAPRTPPGS